MTDGRSALPRSPTRAQLAWVERAVGSGARVTGGRRMLGGITSSVHRLSVRLPGGTSTQVVLKRYTDPDWGDVQAIVRNEAAALAAVGGNRRSGAAMLGRVAGRGRHRGRPVAAHDASAGPRLVDTARPRRLDPPARDVLPSIHAGAAACLDRRAARRRGAHRAGVGAPTGRVDRSEARDHLDAAAVRRSRVRARRLPALQRALVARSPERARRLELVRRSRRPTSTSVTAD